MAYRSIDDTFWVSPKVRELSQDAKLLYLYLISVASNAGLVRTTPDIIEAMAGFEKGLVSPLLGALHEKGRIFWEKEQNLVFVVGQIEHQAMSKGKLDYLRAKGIKNELGNLPEGNTKQRLIEKYGAALSSATKKPHRSPLQAPSNPLANPSDKGKERKGKEIKVNNTKTFLSENQNFSDEVTNLTNLLISKILSNDSKAKTPPLGENGVQDPKWRKWARDADLLLRVDERPFREAEQLIHWCQNSVFWRANIRSMGKFREQYPQLRLKWKAEQDWQPQEKETDEERRKRLIGG